MPLPLSVLDQSPIGAGESAADAIAHSVALAKRCDELGYRRYWVAEHHASDRLASSSPEILITKLAADSSGFRWRDAEPGTQASRLHAGETPALPAPVTKDLSYPHVTIFADCGFAMV